MCVSLSLALSSLPSFVFPWSHDRSAHTERRGGCSQGGCDVRLIEGCYVDDGCGSKVKRERGGVIFPIEPVCVCVRVGRRGEGVMWLCFYYSAVMIRSYDGQHLNTTHYLARYI